jgi:hypothetical protein
MDKVGARTTADLTQHAIKSGLISLQWATSYDGLRETGVRS